jgi:hypothetical protein
MREHLLHEVVKPGVYVELQPWTEFYRRGAKVVPVVKVCPLGEHLKGRSEACQAMSAERVPLDTVLPVVRLPAVNGSVVATDFAIPWNSIARVVPAPSN